MAKAGAKEKNAAIADSALTRLPTIVEERPGFRFVSHKADRRTQTWLFALDETGHRDAARLHLQIEHELGLSILSARLLITSMALARWQAGKSPPDDYHFANNYFLLLPQEAIDADASIHPFGGWKFKASGSEKLLRK